MAEGIFREKVSASNLSHRIECDSCGTSGYHDGENPDRRAIKISGMQGVDISGLISRKIRTKDFGEFHYIIAMDEDNARDIRLFAGHTHALDNKLRRMRDFDPDPGDGNVPDPWYGNEKDFQFVFRMLDRSCDELLKFIRSENSL